MHLNGKIISKAQTWALALALSLPLFVSGSSGSAEGAHQASGSSPEFWVMVFTIISFVAVAGVLGFFGWPQILASLKEREDSIRKSLEAADKARLAAEAQTAEYNKRTAEMERHTQQLMDQAQRQAAELREKLIKDAEAAAKDLMAKTRQQLDQERAQVVKQVRSEMAALVVTASEKLLRKSVDKNVQDQLVKEFASQVEN